jgi:uncharacterized integral membrane protein
MAPEPTISGDQADHATRSSRERARLLAIGILVVIAVLFAVLNFDEVKVHLLFGTATLPLVIVIVICLLVGFVIGALWNRRASKRAARMG